MASAPVCHPPGSRGPRTTGAACCSRCWGTNRCCSPAELRSSRSTGCRSRSRSSTVDAEAAAWLDPGEEFPTDDVQGDSITLTPKKLGLVTGIDVEVIEDASVATLDVVGNSLAKAIATKLDARVFSTAAAYKGPAGLLGTFTPLTKALGVIPLLEAVATIQSKGRQPGHDLRQPGGCRHAPHQTDRVRRQAAPARRGHVAGQALSPSTVSRSRSARPCPQARPWSRRRGRSSSASPAWSPWSPRRRHASGPPSCW